MIAGSCLCGNVRFEIDGPMTGVGHCHCRMCRKAHGAAFATYGDVRREDFRWTVGEEDVARYASTPGVTRTFCRRCGATLQWMRDDADKLGVALGVLDDDPGARPECHIFTDFHAPWYEITDGLPRYPGDDE